MRIWGGKRWEKVSSLERCPQFRNVLVEGSTVVLYIHVCADRELY